MASILFLILSIVFFLLSVLANIEINFLWFLRNIFVIFSILTFLISLTSNLLILSISSNQKHVLIVSIRSSGLITEKSLFWISMVFLSKLVLSKIKYFNNCLQKKTKTI